MQPSRALGLGLIGIGVVLGGVMLLWLVVTTAGGQTTSGGAVLGLLIAAILGLPPIGVGVYVLLRGRQEAVEAAEFETSRRLLDADRLFRAEQARELEQLARRVRASGAPAAQRLAARLRDLVHDLRNPSYDQAAWYEAVKLGPADRQALQRYDDLLSEGTRSMQDLVGRLEAGPARGGEALPALEREIDDWERNLERRTDLIRGRPAPTVAPGELLAASTHAASRDLLAALKVGDAVSYDGQDYLVEVSASYFAGGRVWWLHRLETGGRQAWLYVGPGALSLAWLQTTAAPTESGSATVELDGAACTLEESATAAVTVRTRQGQSSSGTVDTRRYRCADGRLLWIERWPDSARAYAGRPIEPRDLEVYPAAEPESESGAVP